MLSPPFLLFFVVFTTLPNGRTDLIVLGVFVGICVLLEETGLGEKIYGKWRVANSQPQVPKRS